VRSSEPQVVRFEVSVRGLLKIAAAVAACWLLVKLWVVALVVVIALMIVGALEPIVEWMEARKVRRGLALGIVFGGLFLGLAGSVVLITAPLIGQVKSILDRLPEHQQHVTEWVDRHKMLAPLSTKLHQGQPSQAVEQIGGYLLGGVPRMLEYFAYALSAVFLAMYLMIDRDRMRGVLYAVIPKGWHVRTARVILQLQTIVGGYIRGQLLTSAFMGVFLFVLLTAFRVPNALALAALGAFGDVIPYVGVLFTIVPAFLAALSKSVTTAIIVGCACAAYQEFENRVIIPRVYGRVLRLPSAAVLLALLVGGVLGGVLGSILALPFAAAIRMLIEELRVELPGDDQSDEHLRREDEKVERTYEVLAAGASAGKAAEIATELAEVRQKEEPDAPITSGKKER
jgi:predicted PurR-regulated permease PerM